MSLVFFLYPLKTSGNLWFSDVFRRYRKRSVASMKWVNCWKTLVRRSHPEVFCGKGVLRNFAKVTGKHLFQSLFFNKVAGFSLQLYLKRDSSTDVSCEFYEISKNTFSYRTAPVAAFGLWQYTPSKKSRNKSRSECFDDIF